MKRIGSVTMLVLGLLLGLSLTRSATGTSSADSVSHVVGYWPNPAWHQSTIGGVYGWTVTNTGEVESLMMHTYDHGRADQSNAWYRGDLSDLDVSVSNIVAMLPTYNGNGYWLLGSDGGVFSFGNAHFHGSLPGLAHRPSAEAVGMSECTNGGYVVVLSDGTYVPFDCSSGV